MGRTKAPAATPMLVPRKKANAGLSSKTTEHQRGAKSAAEWNSLLLWARKMRGPQWDYGTAQYMVERNGLDYFAGVEEKAK